MKTCICMVVAMLLAWCPLAGQQILFRNYSVKEGLCSNTVWTIAQDDNGYMWFGTRNGLNRFDGYKFTTYKFHENDPHSLGDNFVHKIFRYDKKTLWIGTEKGLYSLDLETELFTPLSLAANDCVFDIIRDSRRQLWIATRSNGIYGYDTATKKSNNFKAGSGNKGLSANQVRALQEDADGRICIGTFGEGIDVFDPATRQFSNFKNGSAEQALNSNRIVYRDRATPAPR